MHGGECAVGIGDPKATIDRALESLWLRAAGGASNSGGAVLRSFFTDGQLTALTSQIDVSAPPGLGYYPLPKAGERFPINDPQLQPRLTPRPDSDAEFLHGYNINLSTACVSPDSF